MKIKFIAFALSFTLILPVCLFADEPHLPQTKIEKLLLQKGNLIISKYYEIGEMQGDAGKIKFASLIISENEYKTRGIKIELKDEKRKDTINSFLDEDELTNLIKAVNQMDILLKDRVNFYVVSCINLIRYLLNRS